MKINNGAIKARIPKNTHAKPAVEAFNAAYAIDGKGTMLFGGGYSPARSVRSPMTMLYAPKIAAGRLMNRFILLSKH